VPAEPINWVSTIVLLAVAAGLMVAAAFSASGTGM
jgi:hypothetical protein